MSEVDTSSSAAPDSPGRTLIFAATYNERDNIEEFTTRVLAVDPRLDILIVDDNSPDGTGRFLADLATRNRRVTVVHRPRKLGLGTAHKLGMLHAIQHEYERLVTMDADFSHDPTDIPRLLAALADHDFVTGSRYMPGGRCDYSGYRRFISLLANRGARTLLAVPLHEFTTSFRGFRVAALRALPVSRLKAQGYSFFLETVYHLHARRLRLTEIPIHFADRKAGRSKIPRLEIFHGIHRMLRLLWARLRRRPRPAPGEPPAEERCYFCSSAYLVERYPRRGPPSDDVRAFQCTSMDHRTKPQVLACMNCGLNFVPLAQVPAQLEHLYAEVVDEKYLENAAGRRRTFRRGWRSIAPHLKAPGTMLEIGSYCGFYLDVAREAGWRVRGVEPSRWAAEYSRKRGHDVHCGTIDDGRFPLRTEGYDAVVLWDVFEHLRDPMAFLEQVHGVLRPDGVLCLTTLDIDNWFPRLVGERWPWLMDMHIFYLNVPAMEQFLARAGFQVERVDAYCHYISARYLGEKMASILPRRLATLARWCTPLLPRFLFLPFRFGEIKLYVARRSAHGIAPVRVAAPAAGDARLSPSAPA